MNFKSKDNNSAKNHQTEPNYNLICKLSWLYYILNIKLISSSMTKKVWKDDLPHRQIDRRIECKPKIPFNFIIILFVFAYNSFSSSFSCTFTF